MTPNAAAETEAPPDTASSVAMPIVVCLGPWYQDAHGDQLTPLMAMLQQALGELASSSVIAYPAADGNGSLPASSPIALRPYHPTSSMHSLPVQTAGNYLNLYELMREQDATCGLLLGLEGHTLSPDAIRGLLHAVLDRGVDLALPNYDIGPNEGLINASILHPLTRSIFGVRNIFPQALDLALSMRMAERMATTAQNYTSSQQENALLWPASEAAVAGYSVAEVNAGTRDLPHPSNGDLTSILNTVASSMFMDIEAKAAFWQRTRQPAQVLTLPGAASKPIAPEPVSPEEVEDLINAFRIGSGNLQEIWSLVLPPQTLLGLKRLSRMASADFALPDALWARIVYDYVLAHRMRTINRGHLMGSLTPLYLAWVASHILAGRNGGTSNAESLARAFEADKPYLVSRWRWPDRFNP